jgi:two-component system response regulator FixJ
MKAGSAPPEDKRTVYIVEDDDAVRDALTMLLTAVGLKVQAFDSPLRFLEHYRSGGPSCLVLDVRMPHMTGLELQDQLLARDAHIPLIFISGHGDIPMAVEAVKKGALDFLEKPFEHHRLLCGVLDALEGDASRRSETVTRETRVSRVAALTDREREVLERILDGKPNRVVAKELFITLKTVEFHRARIMGKLGVKNAAELFRFCLEGEALPRAQ